MTDEQQEPMQGRLVTIAQIAAENIARVLDLPETAVAPLQEAIGDEIAAMSTHFAFTVNDLREQWEKAEGKLTRIRALIAGRGSIYDDEAFGGLWEAQAMGYRGYLDEVQEILDDEPTPEMGTVELSEVPA